MRIGIRRCVGDQAFSIEDGAHRSLAALYFKKAGKSPYEQNIDERRPRVDVDQSVAPLIGNNGKWRSLPVGGTTPKIYLQLK